MLQQLAVDEKQNYTEASQIIRSDIYVDDVITGADTLQEAMKLQKDLSNLVKAGGFHLRKWTSNSCELIKNIKEEYRGITAEFSIYQPAMSKALGINWNATHDYFYVSTNFKFSDSITKSILLSEASKLFDPLGWLSPTTIIAKIIFQKLWKLKLDWNDILPMDLQREWINFRSNLKLLENVKILRWIGYRTSHSTVELHAFSDASKSAYAAVVYARITTESSKVIVSLLQTKTKVVPLKGETILRLELAAATLMANLVAKIKSNLKLKIDNIVYWTDSTIVLVWIKGNSSKLEVFVTNRIEKIRRLTNNSECRQISTKDNPADCASRGLVADKLVHHDLWWNGPTWLQKTPELWPSSYIQPVYDNSSANNVNIHLVNVARSVQFPEITLRFSKLSTLLRVTSCILRFYKNIKSTQNREFGFLKSHEIRGVTTTH